MATAHSPRSIGGCRREDVDDRDAIHLEQVVERLVRFGQQVGVTPEEMISLFDSGISMRDLLQPACTNGSQCLSCSRWSPHSDWYAH